MDFNLKLKVGKRAFSLGSDADIRAGRKGELMVGSIGSKYEQAVIDEAVFIGSNALGTPVTTQAGLSATTPALTLYNPVNSGVNMKLLKVNIGFNAAPAAATILALAYNDINAAAPSSVTNATIVSGIVGANVTPKGKCYRVATLAAAPVAFKYLPGIIAASAINQAGIYEDIDGEIVLAPGACVSIQATTAVAILASFTWSEEPI